MGLAKDSQVKAGFSFKPLEKWGLAVLDWVLPPLCPATGKMVDVQGMVDGEYWASLNFIGHPFCQQCAMPFEFEVEGEVICAQCLANPPAFLHARAAVIYDDASRKIVLRFKHGDQLQAVGALVPWVMRAGADILAEADIIVPVPLHRFRFLKRRYNQAAIMAQVIGSKVKKRSIVDALLRVKATPPQAGLSAKERAANVKGAFLVNPKYANDIRGKIIVLVDDVYTTGATFEACAKALLKAGAGRVDVVCVARAVK